MKGKKKKNYDKINLYLKSKLPDAEQKAMEQQIKKDKNFVETVRKQQEALGYITLMAQRERRHEIKNILAAAPEQKAGKGNRNYLLAIAASVALLLLAGYFFLQKPTYEQLANAYFEPYTFTESNTRSGIVDTRKKAIYFYRQKEYEKALPLLEQHNTDGQTLLMAGIAHYELKQFDEALSKFNFIIQEEDFLYLDKAFWYAALTELKKGNPDAAKLYLRKISEDNAYFDNAEKLLEDLK